MLVVPDYTVVILLDLDAYLFKEMSEKGKTTSSIDDNNKTKEKAECFNDETFYSKFVSFGLYVS